MEIKVKVRIIKEYGANAAVVLGVINQSEEPLTNTDVATKLGLSFPTAQKCLQTLHEHNLIKQDGKKYIKL